MVYVDRLVSYLESQKSVQAQHYGERVKWSHLFSDNEQELHDFAYRLGLKKEWFQNKVKFPHYDIVESKRKLALKLGAQEVDLREYLKKVFYCNNVI